MTNRDFLKMYVDGEITQGAHGRMAYKDGRIISYETPICDLKRSEKKAYLNVRKYSTTTSKMQNTLTALLEDAGYDIETYVGQDAYIWDRYDSQRWTVSVNDVR